jgi:hypothetical protein
MIAIVCLLQLFAYRFSGLEHSCSKIHGVPGNWSSVPWFTPPKTSTILPSLPRPCFVHCPSIGIMLIITVFLFWLSVFSLLITDSALVPVQERLYQGLFFEFHCSTLALASTISRIQPFFQGVISCLSSIHSNIPQSSARFLLEDYPTRCHHIMHFFVMVGHKFPSVLN